MLPKITCLVLSELKSHPAADTSSGRRSKLFVLVSAAQLTLRFKVRFEHQNTRKEEGMQAHNVFWKIFLIVYCVFVCFS